MWINSLLKRLIVFGTGKQNYFKMKFSSSCQVHQEHIIKADDLLKTDMIVQDGFNIYELPIIIKKTNDFTKYLEEQKSVDFVVDNVNLSYSDVSKLIKGRSNRHVPGTVKPVGNSKIDSIPILFNTELELIQNMDVEEVLKKMDNTKCKNKSNSRLESFIYNEINSKIALQTLKKVFEQDRKHRKYKRTTKSINNRFAIVKQLIQYLINTKDSEIILQALTLLSKDKHPLNRIFKDMLVNEVLFRSMNGDFTVQQLIDIIDILTSFKQFKYYEAIDYLWTGLIIRQEDITADNLVALFKLLIYMKQSRNRVQSLLEKKLTQNYHKLEVYQMTDILVIFKNDLQSPVVMKCASDWANMYLPSIPKYHVLEFIESLNDMKFINSSIEKSIEKTLMKNKIKKKDYILITSIAAYCSNVRLRSLGICNRIEKYLTTYANNFPLSSFIEVIGTFGKLNYFPEHKDKFWKTFENRLDQKFLEFKDNEILYVLLSCAYINKYFVKYANQIFTLEFLNKLHHQKDSRSIQFLRDQLYILDIAMTLECPAYKGPILYNPKQASDPVSVDLRVNEIIHKIQDQLVALAGDEKKLSKHVSINKFAATGLYTLDALIHKDIKPKAIVELNLAQEKNENTAVLVVLPDYYCWNSNDLIGEQAMKVRHLRKIGFRVMLLDFKVLCELHDQPHKLKSYLSTTYAEAHQAL